MTRTFAELIKEVRVSATETKQTQFLTSDLLVQILKVLIEIRDELKTPGKTESWFRPENGTGDLNET